MRTAHVFALELLTVNHDPVPTWAGTSDIAAPPVPSCPTLFGPQHQSELFAWMPQVWFWPPVTALHLAVPIFTGAFLPTVVPSPTLPKKL